MYNIYYNLKFQKNSNLTDRYTLLARTYKGGVGQAKIFEPIFAESPWLLWLKILEREYVNSPCRV